MEKERKTEVNPGRQENKSIFHGRPYLLQFTVFVVQFSYKRKLACVSTSLFYLYLSLCVCVTTQGPGETNGWTR